MNRKLRHIFECPCYNSDAGRHVYHQIGISKKGRIALLNHGNCPIYRWDGWQDIGGEPPSCVKAVLYFIKRIKEASDGGIDRVGYDCTSPLRWYLINCIEKKRVRRAIRDRRNNLRT